MKKLSPLLATILFFVSAASNAGDADDLTEMLHDFLAHADQEAAHETFWADDLVYTSSGGTRTNKAEILSGFSGEEDEDNDEQGPVYSAEDVQLKVYGTTAVIAFKLVATPPDDSTVQYYFNTGTFLKRDGIWQVVAWQATKIPLTQATSLSTANRSARWAARGDSLRL